MLDTAATDKEKGLWVTDAELIRRMGVPEKTARETLRMLDAKPNGFPRKQKLWGDRRYWPAVKDYFDKVYGVKVRRLAGIQCQVHGEEKIMQDVLKRSLAGEKTSDLERAVLAYLAELDNPVPDYSHRLTLRNRLRELTGAPAAPPPRQRF